MKNLIIVGSSGHARVIIEILKKRKRYNILGLIDPLRTVNDQVSGYYVLGSEADIPNLVNKYGQFELILAIGDNHLRCMAANKIKSICPELHFGKCIHSSAQIASDVRIEEGTVIMANTVVNSNTRIGCHCILNTNCSLDHDSVMDDFSSLAPGVVTGGNVKIGKHSAICIGATVKNNLIVSENCIVGAGSVFLSDTVANSVYYGTPAKLIRPHTFGDRYL